MILEATSAAPLLIPGAIDGVKNWVYQPKLLNEEPVGVLPEVAVNFSLCR